MHDRSRRTILRERTAEAHAALDRTIGTFDDIVSYKTYLRGMGAFRLPVETMLAATGWPQGLLVFPRRDVGDLIRADLADLGVTAGEPVDLPKLGPTPEAMLGTLYVLEGSALGARLLYRRAQALGLSAEFGARHLSAQSARDDRWNRFLALLESADAIEIDHVAEASEVAFQVAEAAFKRAFHEAD